MSSSPTGDEDPYVSLNALGEGGFGSIDEVYKRSDLSRIRYARKRFKRPTVRANERQSVFEKLRDEAGILRSISFRHIVKLIECYTWKDNIFIVMSPVAETDLAKFLAHLNSLQESPERNDARSVVLQWPGCLIRAIEYLHKKRIKHRDIKPSNILVKHGRVYLTDFDISRVVADNDTTGSIGPVGPRTYKYSAPEVIREEGGRRGRSADIFSLGCVLLEISTALIAPPGSQDLFARLRLERTGNLAYALNSTLIIQWILHLWAHWSIAAQQKDADDECILLGIAVPDLAFLMLDPDPAKRIMANELVDMISTPELYYFSGVHETACRECRAVFHERAEEDLHSVFKGTNDIKYAENPEHALEILPAPDWESTKREWLKSHKPWTKFRGRYWRDCALDGDLYSDSEVQNSTNERTSHQAEDSAG